LELTERDEKRFWAKVALPDEQGCMLWLKAQNGDGYGLFRIGRRVRRAHRVSYVIAYGPIPLGMEIDHVKDKGCTNRHCVAPEHLEAVTHAENVRRGDLGALWRAKTHCPQGHEYTPENTYQHDGRRSCRACHRQRRRVSQPHAYASWDQQGEDGW
jgi:hypothetical protein